MAIKLIAIDMDGTLLLPDHTISPAVKTAIAAARERGVNVVLTTGRPYAGVHSYLKELHMEQPGDYCITYNGALVQKASDGSTVAQTALGYDDYRYLEQLARLSDVALPAAYVTFTGKDGAAHRFPYKEYRENEQRIRRRFGPCRSFAYEPKSKVTLARRAGNGRPAPPICKPTSGSWPPTRCRTRPSVSPVSLRGCGTPTAGTGVSW